MSYVLIYISDDYTVKSVRLEVSDTPAPDDCIREFTRTTFPSPRLYEQAEEIARGYREGTVFVAMRDDGKVKEFTQDMGPAIKWLAGLEPHQTWDEFVYPAYGGKVYKNGKRVAGMGADGGCV